MTRNEYITGILENGGGGNWDLWERYSTSDLKQIFNDITTVRVKTDSSVNMSILLVGSFLVLAIYILK